jgi:NAD(P)-dependent dehydrogenase (short-subunit alcohol dehydrogenase family)
LARDGAKVVVNYVNDKKGADATVAAINTVPGSAAIAVQVIHATYHDVSHSVSIFVTNNNIITRRM